MDQNHNCVDSSVFGLENAPYTSSTSKWDKFVGELDFDNISASSDHAKPSKGIYTEHVRKVWLIDLESAQKTQNVTNQRVVSTNNPKLTRNFGTCDRTLRYKRIRYFLYGYFLCK